MALVGELFGSIVRYAGGPVTCERCPRGPAICHFHGPRGVVHLTERPPGIVRSILTNQIVGVLISAPLRSQKG